MARTKDEWLRTDFATGEIRPAGAVFGRPLTTGQTTGAGTLGAAQERRPPAPVEPPYPDSLGSIARAVVDAGGTPLGVFTCAARLGAWAELACRQARIAGDPRTAEVYRLYDAVATGIMLTIRWMGPPEDPPLPPPPPPRTTETTTPSGSWLRRLVDKL